MKKRTDYYINGLGIISPQKTFDNAVFLPELTSHDNNVLKCVIPDFKEYINPAQLRRLSKMLRIGLSAAAICASDSKNAVPDGIITATGYGFLDDTAKFLNEILQWNEQQLTPTLFMQSTYNALAGLVALTLKCKGYNNTHVSKGFAFETALYDVMMQVNAENSKTFLVGAYDEAEAGQYNINSRAGHYKTEIRNNLELFNYPYTTGSLQGEGCAFFSISGRVKENSWCILKDVKMLFRPEEENDVVNAVQIFLLANALTTVDIDVWINGASGDIENDALLKNLDNELFQSTPQLRFKHLSGEYCTASSFGVWLGASVLKKQHIPDAVKFNTAKKTLPIRKVLVVNQYMGKNYSLILLSA